MFDVTVIGGGPGGYSAAIRAGQHGLKTALIEKERLGGTCLNWGCIPTKSLHYVASVYKSMLDSSLGIQFENHRLNYEQTSKRNREIVEHLTKGIEYLLKKNGVTVIEGRAALKDPQTVIVNDVDEIQSKNIIVATGSSVFIPAIPGTEFPGVWSSRELLAQTTLPSSLVIIGGGVIGIEFASILSAFGVDTAVIEMEKQILPHMDCDLAGHLEAQLKKQGIKIKTGARVKEISYRGDKLEVIYELHGKSESVQATNVLLAVGRHPCFDNLGLEAADINFSKNGIQVNESMQTSSPTIYAIGDVVGGKMLAHKAFHDAAVAVENILGRNKTASYTVVPDCVFSLPEVASVGMSEQDLKERGMQYKVSVFPFAANGKAITCGETEGFVKVITLDSQIVGTHIIGGHAAEMIHEAALAVFAEFKAEELADLIHAHPTMSEGFHEAVLGSFGKMLHF